METRFTQPQRLELAITSSAEPMLTTVLQAGVVMIVESGISIGVFLAELPGFSAEYIEQHVQTIFLNGTATDDLQTPLSGAKQTLAISAAMPGLAGAIFRKNSLHSALRSVLNTTEEQEMSTTTTVTLKLFNTIARDRGIQLLRRGVCIEAKKLAGFLRDRQPLQAQLQKITLVNREISSRKLLAELDRLSTVQLSLAGEI